MNLYMIMGAPHSGKTTFVRDTFKSDDVIFVDIIDSEVESKTQDEAMLKCRLKLDVAMTRGLLDHKDVVFEFPGLTEGHRSFFMRHVKQRWMPPNRVVGIWVDEEDSVLYERINLGNRDGLAILHKLRQIIQPVSVEEGFDEILHVEGSHTVPSSEEYFVTQAQYHCQYIGDDSDVAMKKFFEWSNGKDRMSE